MPTADMPVDAQSAPYCTSVVIEHGGTDA